MKILIVSDSHGHDLLLRDLVKQYPNMDYYLHAGDSQSSMMSIYPFDSVKGNCDYFDFDVKRKIYTPKGYLLMKHFPTISKGEIEDIKFFIHGHTHKYQCYKENNYYVICPGSIALPRDGTLGSYAILEINEKESIVTIYELDSKNILIRMKIM